MVDSHAYLQLYAPWTVNKVLEQLGIRREMFSLPEDSGGRSVDSGNDADIMILKNHHETVDRPSRVNDVVQIKNVNAVCCHLKCLCWIQ